MFICFSDEKLEESSQQMQGQMWEQHAANLLGYDQLRQSPHQQQAPHHGGNGFFHPLDPTTEPTLQIGYVLACLYQRVR